MQSNFIDVRFEILNRRNSVRAITASQAEKQKLPKAVSTYKEYEIRPGT